MIELGETILIGLAAIMMIGVLLISIIPLIPGPLLMWLAAMAFGVAEGVISGGGLTGGFHRLHPVAAVIMTVIMLVGSTSEFWMPVLGMRAQGASCWGSLGTLLGGIAGTFFIPMPICGTMIGAVAGALLFELIHVGDAREAFKVGGLAVRVYFMELAVEYGTSIVIFAVFVASLLLTA